MHCRQLAAEQLDSAHRGGGILGLRLLREHAPAHPDEGQAQLDQNGQRRERARDRDVECLPKFWIVSGVFRAPRDDCDLLELERGTRVHEEGRLRLVGLDERDIQVGPLDLDRDSRQSRSRADVDQASRVAEMLEQDQAVVDQRPVGRCHQAGPRRDQPSELFELRIFH